MKTQTKKVLSLPLALAALGLSLSPIQQVKGAGFVSVSPMNNARNFHTATFLPNGKVLVAGGSQTVTSELYDPAIWRRWFLQALLWACALARESAGSNSAARMAIMAMTTKSSTSVNALGLGHRAGSARFGAFMFIFIRHQE